MKRLPAPLLAPARLALVLLAAGSALGSPHASAQALPEGLSVHGFLTQAYGRSTGGQSLGIDEDGTADYRVAALQFRYDWDALNTFVLQFSHERLGDSPLAALEPEVALDWVFYERRFADRWFARVGKVRSPLGIYNEIRDVGTLLPFYRPPATVYGEHMHTSETLDGAVLGSRIPIGAWEVSVEAFLGNWRYLQLDFESYAKVRDGYGGQIWLYTPFPGLRVGGGGTRYTATDLLGTPEGSEATQYLLQGSIDGQFGPVRVRSEIRHSAFGGDELGYEGTSQGYYGELVYSLTDELSLAGQAQWYDFAVDVATPFSFSIDENFDRSYSVGVKYAPSPNLALKLEGRRYRGYGDEDQDLMISVDDRAHINYALFSVSTSF